MILRFFISLILCLFFSCCVVRAEVNISLENRVANSPDIGICAWCCVEMSGRTLGIHKVKNLAKKRLEQSQEWIITGKERRRRNDAGGTVEKVCQQLHELGIKYKYCKEFEYDYSLLAEGTSSGGTIVGVMYYGLTEEPTVDKDYFLYAAPEYSSGYHAILVTDITADKVKFIDCNNIQKPWIISREWFDSHWDGSAVILIAK